LKEGKKRRLRALRGGGEGGGDRGEIPVWILSSTLRGKVEEEEGKPRLLPRREGKKKKGGALRVEEGGRGKVLFLFTP